MSTNPPIADRMPERELQEALHAPASSSAVAAARSSSRAQAGGVVRIGGGELVEAARRLIRRPRQPLDVVARRRGATALAQRRGLRARDRGQLVGVHPLVGAREPVVLQRGGQQRALAGGALERLGLPLHGRGIERRGRPAATGQQEHAQERGESPSPHAGVLPAGVGNQAPAACQLRWCTSARP